MAGPATLALGGHAFQAYGFGYANIGKRTDRRWATIPVAGGSDALQWTGGAGKTTTIRGVLFPVEFGGLDTLAAIERLADRGAVVPLVSIGSGYNILDMFVIEGIDSDEEFHDASGMPRMDVYSIDLTAFPGRDFTPVSVLQGLF